MLLANLNTTHAYPLRIQMFGMLTVIHVTLSFWFTCQMIRLTTEHLKLLTGHLCMMTIPSVHSPILV